MKRRRHILPFCLLSILLHILLLATIGYLHREKEKVRDDRPVEVVLLKRPYQIADIEPPAKEERPDDARFLGLYDSRVQDEQVAPSRRPSAGRPSSLLPKGEGSETSREKRGEGPALRKPEKGVESRFEGEEDLGGLPDDFFPDYKIGDRTYLNVLRYPKVGYFVRLKKIFRTTFNPVPAIRPYYLSNQISHGQVEVVLGVTLDRNGRLADLRMIRSSGLDLYDKEAMRTIRDSAPFAAPPSDLLDPQSFLKMAWTFTVYL